MKVLVCGGRRFGKTEPEMALMENVLYLAHSQFHIDLLIQGGAPGADKYAILWALRHGVKALTFPADWSRGKKAGPLRNQEMINERPDLVIAFPGGRGTADLLSRAKACGVKRIWEYP